MFHKLKCYFRQLMHLFRILLSLFLHWAPATAAAAADVSPSLLSFFFSRCGKWLPHIMWLLVASCAKIVEKQTNMDLGNGCKISCMYSKEKQRNLLFIHYNFFFSFTSFTFTHTEFTLVVAIEMRACVSMMINSCSY